MLDLRFIALYTTVLMIVEGHADLLTPKQLSTRIGRTVETLCVWRQRGIGPAFVRRGGRIYYPLAAFSRWQEIGDPCP
jgi:hypothetical protein